MPDITPSSFLPERRRFTLLRVAKSLLMYTAASAAFIASAGVIGRTLSSSASHADSLYGLANTFGTDIFTDVRPEILWGSIIALVMTPIFIGIALAGANKAAQRSLSFTDQEWY